MTGMMVKYLPRSGVWGGMLLEEGDSISLTFIQSGCHTPILKGISKTVTTLCDYDIGVAVYD